MHVIFGDAISVKKGELVDWLHVYLTNPKMAGINGGYGNTKKNIQ
jgi:hypothetical protein